MRQAVIAALAGILLVGAAALQLSGPHTKVNELTLDLITAHKRFPIDVIGAVINGIGLCALAATLAFLLDITRARNELVKPWIRWMVIVGGVVAGDQRGRLRDRHRRQGRHVRQPGSADLRAGQSSDQCARAARPAVHRPGFRAPAGGRVRARRAPGDAGRAADALHGLPRHLHRYPRAVPDRVAGARRAGLLVARAGLPVLRALAERRAAVLAQRPRGEVALLGGAARAAHEGLRPWRRGGGGGRSKPAPKQPARETVAAPAAQRTRASTGKRKRKRRR